MGSGSPVAVARRWCVRPLVRASPGACVPLVGAVLAAHTALLSSRDRILRRSNEFFVATRLAER
jgi:hypothetical protein